MALKMDENNLPFIECGKHIIRLEADEPNEEYMEKAKKELREVPEIVEKSIVEFRELILNEPNFHFPTDNEYLKMFLRPCKFYPESAHKRVQNFFKFKLKHPKVSNDILPGKIRHVFEQGVARLLPLRDQHGRRIFILEIGRQWKPSKCPLFDVFKTVQLSVLASMSEPVTQICGSVIIFDMEDLPLSHVTQFTPSFAKMILDYAQECLCIRLKGIHIVNNSYIFNMLFAIFKPFIGDKLKHRIFFHGKDWDTLASHIDRECLPKKYGGTLDMEYPPGNLVGDLFELYKKDLEMAGTYGYTKI